MKESFFSFLRKPEEKKPETPSPESRIDPKKLAAMRDELLQVFHRPDQQELIEKTYQEALATHSWNKFYGMHESAKYKGYLGAGLEQVNAIKKPQRLEREQDNEQTERETMYQTIIEEFERYPELKNHDAANSPKRIETYRQIFIEQYWCFTDRIRGDLFLKRKFSQAGFRIEEIVDALKEIRHGLYQEMDKKDFGVRVIFKPEYTPQDQKQAEDDFRLFKQFLAFNPSIAYSRLSKIVEELDPAEPIAASYQKLLCKELQRYNSFEDFVGHIYPYDSLQKAKNPTKSIPVAISPGEFLLEKMVTSSIKHGTKPELDAIMPLAQDFQKKYPKSPVSETLLQNVLGCSRVSEENIALIAEQTSEPLGIGDLLDMTKTTSAETLKTIMDRWAIMCSSSDNENLKKNGKQLQELIKNSWLPSWMKTNYREDYKEQLQGTTNEYIAQNLQRILAIEEKEPGATILLHKEFGIKNFARYSTDLLTMQARQAEMKDMPYGIALYTSAEDWNGAFNTQQQIFDNLQEQLAFKQTGLRIVEASSTIEMAKRLAMLNNKYGDRQKISFAIIGGHGDEDGVTLGNYPEKSENYSRITFDIVNGPGAKRAGSEYFAPEAPFILVSCSTGKNEGIGQLLSKRYGTTVIAPEVPASIKTINVTSEAGGRLKFDVKYWEKDAERFYTAGILQTPQP